jgi:hypothetical protein
MGLEFSSGGAFFPKTEAWLNRMKTIHNQMQMERYGQMGVAALERYTPVDSGETQHSWYYTIEPTKTGSQISWRNRHIVEGVNIAVILQYGHGTGTGGYVQGRDYINPALRPIFDQFAKDLERVVTG